MYKTPKGSPLPKDKYRIVMFGSQRVGKTSIISRFMYGKVPADYKMTIEDMHRENYDVQKRNLLLEVLDTAGWDEFPAMRSLAITQGNAFMLVYSPDVEGSFSQVERLREQILEGKGHSNSPIVVVCNKADTLRTDHCDIREHALTVSGWGCKHIYASATDNINITGIFIEILSQAHLCPEIPRSRSEITKELIEIRNKVINRCCIEKKPKKPTSCYWFKFNVFKSKK
jgi:small GTP-binding protein